MLLCRSDELRPNSINHQTHSTRGLSSGSTDLHTDIRSGNEHLGNGHAESHQLHDLGLVTSPVVGDEADSKQVSDSGVVVLRT